MRMPLLEKKQQNHLVRREDRMWKSRLLVCWQTTIHLSEAAPRAPWVISALIRLLTF